MSETTTQATWPTQLPDTMQAVVAYGPGDYRFETVDVPRACWGAATGRAR